MNKVTHLSKLEVYTSILFAILMLFVPTSEVLAQENRPPSEANLRKRGLIFIDPNKIVAPGCRGTTITGGGSGKLGVLPPEIPEPYKTLFPLAAQKADVDVNLLATIFYVEHGRSFPDPPPPYGNGDPWASSDVGASGPFQFMPGTWSGVINTAASLNIQISNIQDLSEAAVGASVFIRSLGATPEIMPIGDPNNAIGRYWDDSEATVVNIMASYNAGPGYDSRKRRYTETENYVKYGSEFYDALINGRVSTLLSTGGTASGIKPSGLINSGCSTSTGGNYSKLESVTYYGQCDASWSGVSFGDRNICYSGCGPTSLAMVFATLKGDPGITPPQIAKIVMDEGYHVPGEGISHAAFVNLPPKYGLKVQALGKDIEAVKSILGNGGLVIAAMGPGHFTSRGHIIVLRAVTAGGKILVADPNDSLVGLDDYQRKSKTEWDESIIVSESGGFWGITK